MNTSGYLLRSVALLMAALASFPTLALLGYMLGEGEGRMLALFIALPVAHLGIGIYWIWLTHKRIRELRLPIYDQVTPYAALAGSAKAIALLPVMVFANAPVGGWPPTPRSFFPAETFLPLVMLLMTIYFLVNVPPASAKRNNFDYSQWTLASTAFLILCLAPEFAWPLGGLFPGNPYWIQRSASFGLPPTIPAVLALVALAFTLNRQIRRWRSAEGDGDQALV